MHELVNRSLESFLRDTYGEVLWQTCVSHAGLTDTGVDPLLGATDGQSRSVIDGAALSLSKSVEDLLEDFGTYLISHDNCQRLRRLLRFSGDTFEDLLHSLDELTDRARLAVGDLAVPRISIDQRAADRFIIRIAPDSCEFPYVALGALRAMADDYGALILLEPVGVWPRCRPLVDPSLAAPGQYALSVVLLDDDFAHGNGFSLASDKTPTCHDEGVCK